MSTLIAKHDFYLVENWDTKTLIDFLKEQNLKLNNKKHYDILRNREIDEQVFIDMSKEDFMQAGLEMGPAMKFAKKAKTLKEKLKRSFSSYCSLKKVLAKYGIDSNGTDTIPIFSLQTHEIQDSNKHFEHCMVEILVRLKNYGSLVFDSLEAMRNEYVVAILHTAINITRDATGKEFSMRPEYEIVGDKSSGQVDFTIKVIVYFFSRTKLIFREYINILFFISGG